MQKKKFLITFGTTFVIIPQLLQLLIATATPTVAIYGGVIEVLMIINLIHKFPLFNGIRIVISWKQPTTDPYSEPNKIQFQLSRLIFPR